MALKLRPIEHDDIEAATQCGVAAWLNAMSFTIETLNSEDILRLEQAFRFSFLYHLSGEASADECLVIADLGGQIVGHCECDCSRGGLKNLWVAPNWQGQGIASALLADARERLMQAGHDGLRLTLWRAIDVLLPSMKRKVLWKKNGSCNLILSSSVTWKR